MKHPFDGRCFALKGCFVFVNAGCDAPIPISIHGHYTLRADNAATLSVIGNTIEAGVNRTVLLNSSGPRYFTCNFFTDGSPVTSDDVAGGGAVTFGECE